MKKLTLLFNTMFVLLLLLSGCVATPSGDYSAKSKSPEIGYFNIKSYCWSEAEIYGVDYISRKSIFDKCMQRQGYDKDGNYVGIPKK